MNKKSIKDNMTSSERMEKYLEGSELTEEEIRHNAAIDAVRFKGAAAPLVATGPFEPQAGAIIVIR